MVGFLAPQDEGNTIWLKLMTDKPADWKPSLDEAALKDLIRAALEGAGDIAPDALPSTIRERIKGRVSGDLDVESVVRDVLREQARKA